MTPTTLSTRALSRATLERQLLLRRVDMDAAEAVTHLVGLQTQLPHNHYTALWSRLAHFDAEDFSRRFAAREFVRISLQRSTIHTVTARDCLALRPVLQPAQRGSFSSFARRLAAAGVDADEVAARAAELVAEEPGEPMTFHQLGTLLAEEWPEADAQALGMAARHLLPMVQVTPRGLWGRGAGGGLARHTTVREWLGEDPGSDTSPDALVLRYLAAFGPASVKDVQMWSGLTRLREVVERHRDALVTFRDPDGVELYDLPEAPRPSPEAEAPARFLPEYDNVFLGHKDRTRVIRDEDKGRTWEGNRQFPVFLSDGFVEGTWQRDGGTLTLFPFRVLSPAARGALEREAGALLAFHAPDTPHDVCWAGAGQRPGRAP
ncbi:winged helix DNA-binding domain-containing protein [Streptomyces sp. NPDC048172]|uniref:winged helix DNA-binding domain-containing protein n=1 Tax=Streptomyces sp. NPDC048172 TaxID=3365505 RepID=UPI00371C5743